MRLRLDLDADTGRALTHSAITERRPLPAQAEVLLRRALGLPLAPNADPASWEAAGDKEANGDAA